MEWRGDKKLTVYDKTQGVVNVQNYLTKIFGLSKDDCRVINQYMGGGFGSGLRPQYSVFLAVLASLELKRSVRVTLTRQQMFSFGHRPHTLQYVKLGTNPMVPWPPFSTTPSTKPRSLRSTPKTW
ncbi:molybdopterin cofactor-binding domain-containing protein [Hymenobacter sp. 5516J-16]|uniref:molybdopterin cofactor-binding domain-containing protein n=1 Tax=Hymenobacter sp. 5516J-16 TaxID=2932253 RepID=UPI00293E5C84|nr:molybdopterin cofactor-binding domain-containing protein [Hymenobacter sp. 5516J-16]